MTCLSSQLDTQPTIAIALAVIRRVSRWVNNCVTYSAVGVEIVMKCRDTCIYKGREYNRGSVNCSL